MYKSSKDQDQMFWIIRITQNIILEVMWEWANKLRFCDDNNYYNNKKLNGKCQSVCCRKVHVLSEENCGFII